MELNVENKNRMAASQKPLKHILTQLGEEQKPVRKLAVIRKTVGEPVNKQIQARKPAPKPTKPSFNLVQHCNGPICVKPQLVHKVEPVQLVEEEHDQEQDQEVCDANLSENEVCVCGECKDD